MFDVRCLTFDVLELKYRNHDPTLGMFDGRCLRSEVKMRVEVLDKKAESEVIRDQ